MKTNRFNTEILPSSTQQPTSTRKVFRKTWTRSVTVTSWKTLKAENAIVEAGYHRIIAHVKKHHQTSDEQYFERDYKHDPNEGILAMHTFLTATFYIFLECQLTLAFNVEYAFLNCPYEAEVRKLLQVFPLDTKSKQVAVLPDFITFYERTLAIQEPQFIHSLKA